MAELVQLDVWGPDPKSPGRDGKPTRSVRVGGRPVQDIAADLSKVIADMDYEWSTLGQGYKYRAGTDTPETECPDHNGLAVYVTHGGSEGHLVHVDLILLPEGGDGSYMIHKKLFMVKTFGGAKAGQEICLKLQTALNVL